MPATNGFGFAGEGMMPAFVRTDCCGQFSNLDLLSSRAGAFVHNGLRGRCLGGALALVVVLSSMSDAHNCSRACARDAPAGHLYSLEKLKTPPPPLRGGEGKQEVAPWVILKVQHYK